MTLQDSITVLQKALDDLVEAALSDDLTPLRNSLAMRKMGSSVGTSEDHADAVVFGDINHFHAFNEQYGHDVGDAAITHIGGLIETIADECEAQAFRRSGNEFVIVLRETALPLFESKVPSFSSCAFPIEDITRNTAMSFGYAVSDNKASFEELLARAETACQVAKSKGDGVCIQWTDQIERRAMKSVRGRCTKCEASIIFYASAEVLPANRKPVCCPCCASSFS